MRTHTEITRGFRLVMINALIDAAGNSGRTWHLPWYSPETADSKEKGWLA